MGEDSNADEFNFKEGAGKDLVVIRNFVTDTTVSITMETQPQVVLIIRL